MNAYADLSALEEDDRILLMVQVILETQLTLGFVVEDDEQADRYLEKIRNITKKVHVISRGQSVS